MSEQETKTAEQPSEHSDYLKVDAAVSNTNQTANEDQAPGSGDTQVADRAPKQLIPMVPAAAPRKDLEATPNHTELSPMDGLVRAGGAALRIIKFPLPKRPRDHAYFWPAVTLTPLFFFLWQAEIAPMSTVWGDVGTWFTGVATAGGLIFAGQSIRMQSKQRKAEESARDAAERQRVEDLDRAEKLRTEDLDRAEELRIEDVNRAEKLRIEDVNRAEKLRIEDVKYAESQRVKALADTRRDAAKLVEFRSTLFPCINKEPGDFRSVTHVENYSGDSIYDIEIIVPFLDQKQFTQLIPMIPDNDIETVYSTDFPGHEWTQPEGEKDVDLIDEGDRAYLLFTDVTGIRWKRTEQGLVHVST